MLYHRKKEFLKNIFCKFPIITVISLCLIACQSNSNVSNVNKQISKSTHYTEEEIERAMDVVVEQFQSTDFDNCTLTDLWYDEESSLEQQTAWAKQYNVEHVIIIPSHFKTGNLSNSSPLTSHTDYNNYNWILVKNENNWELRDQGY